MIPPFELVCLVDPRDRVCLADQLSRALYVFAFVLAAVSLGEEGRLLVQLGGGTLVLIWVVMESVLLVSALIGLALILMSAALIAHLAQSPYHRSSQLTSPIGGLTVALSGETLSLFVSGCRSALPLVALALRTPFSPALPSEERPLQPDDLSLLVQIPSSSLASPCHA